MEGVEEILLIHSNLIFKNEKINSIRIAVETKCAVTNETIEYAGIG